MTARWRTICLVGSGVFLTLALAVSVGGVFPVERGLYEWVVGGVAPGVVTTFSWINYLGDRYFLIPMALVLAPLVLFLHPPSIRQRWWLWVGVVLAAPLLEWIAKEVVSRPRPSGTGMGFPSGHVTAAAAFFVITAYLAERLLAGRGARRMIWIVAGVAILLVGIARMVLRAHWPLDTIGGAGLGVACAAGAIWWHERQS
ncbi:MAG: phosphatase PAP2 family protein [Candidatus Methylomirabilia bacterium]